MAFSPSRRRNVAISAWTSCSGPSPRWADLLLQQVRHDLGVGLGAEGVAAILKLAAQVAVVLDDAVVDDRQAAGAVEVRVGVLVGDAAVGRPAGVAEPDGAAGQRGLGLPDLAGPLLDHDRAVSRHGDAPGVVAAILELLQPVQDELRCVGARADVAENAAHRQQPPYGRQARGIRRRHARTARQNARARGMGQLTSDAQGARSPHLERPLSGRHRPGLLRSLRPCRPGGHPPNLSIDPHLVTRRLPGQALGM